MDLLVDEQRAVLRDLHADVGVDERERLGGGRSRERERENRRGEKGPAATRPARHPPGRSLWKLTTGASRSPASATSKNSRFANPNMPAKSTAGKVWIALW